MSLYVFIPDSLLPADYMPQNRLPLEPPPMRIWSPRDEPYPPSWYNGGGIEPYLWSSWYSFVLDPRNESEFMLENSDIINALGMNLMLIQTEGAENFFAAADPLIQSITINAVMFWIVLALVMGLVSFLYIHQRRKDFAVVRVLGCKFYKAIARLCVPVLLFGLPAVIAGSVTGYLIALREAANTLNHLDELATNFEPIVFSVSMLVIILAVTFIVLFLMILFGAVYSGKRPVLELLQGRTSRKERR
jgi:hypothetical protein